MTEQWDELGNVPVGALVFLPHPGGLSYMSHQYGIRARVIGPSAPPRGANRITVYMIDSLRDSYFSADTMARVLR